MGRGGKIGRLHLRAALPVGLLVLLGLLGTALALYTIQPFGPGVSKDAAEYLSAARSLERSGPGDLQELLGLSGDPFILWPPFYPILLAGLNLVSRSGVFTLGGWLNALLYGAAVTLGGLVVLRWGQRHSPRLAGLWAGAAALVLLIAPPLFWIGINILSDLVLIVFSLLFVLLVGRYLECASGHPRELRLLALGLSLCAGLAVVTRYIGAVLIPLGALAVLLRGWQPYRAFVNGWPATAPRAWGARLRQALAVAALSAGPLLLWMMRNIVYMGRPFGPRGEPRWTLAANLRALNVELDFWFRPLNWEGALLLVGGLALLGLGLAALRGQFRAGLRSLARALLDPYALPGLALGALYLPALVASEMLTNITRIDQRLLAPAYFPGVLLGVVLLAWLNETWRHLLPGRWPRAAALAGLLLLLAVGRIQPAQTLAQTVTASRRDGVSVYNYLNTRAFHDFPATRYLLAHPLPPRTAIYSNYAAVVNLFTGRHADASPFRFNPLSPKETYPLSRYAATWPPEPEAYLVWFELPVFDHYYPPQALSEIVELTPLFEQGGAGVYRIHSRAPE